MTPDQRAAQQADVDSMEPEFAAQFLRNLERAGIGDVETRLMLARRGQQSENPGEAESMRKYEAVIEAGRRVQYATGEIQDFSGVKVPAQLRGEIEEIFKGWPA